MFWLLSNTLSIVLLFSQFVDEKTISTDYVVLHLRGDVGFVSQDHTGKYIKDEYISAESISKVFKKLKSYKNIEHIVFSVDAGKVDDFEVSKIIEILEKNENRFDYYLIEIEKGLDSLKIAHLCQSVYESKSGIRNGYEVVEKEQELYESEFRKSFWKEYIKVVPNLSLLESYEVAKVNVERFMPQKIITPRSIGRWIQLVKNLKFPNWNELDSISRVMQLTIKKSHKSHVADLKKERSKLTSIVAKVVGKKNSLIGLPEMKKMAEKNDPNNFSDYETEEYGSYKEYTDGYGNTRGYWDTTTRLTRGAIALWNKRLYFTIDQWSTISTNISSSYINPLADFNKITSDEANSATQRELRDYFEVQINEELTNFKIIYNQVLPFENIANQKITYLSNLEKSYYD
ncbi:MAG: hypothetical protein HOI88_00190 [Phycisphaerae bacterium]|jgi:hypothetical protein|nr:hypothetical protein [Phycisphaerae bacterium]